MKESGVVMLFMEKQQCTIGFKQWIAGALGTGKRSAVTLVDFLCRNQISWSGNI
jgi:hypothetical protein